MTGPIGVVDVRLIPVEVVAGTRSETPDKRQEHLARHVSSAACSYRDPRSLTFFKGLPLQPAAAVVQACVGCRLMADSSTGREPGVLFMRGW